MKKANPNLPILTKNDKEVLKKIIFHSKISNGEIADEIGISPQAVFKIRNKLEESKIIKGYTPIIDFKKIGINDIALLIISFKPVIWEKYTEEIIRERIIKIPFVISAYRVTNRAQISHIILFGFRDNVQKERYLQDLQTKFSNEIEIKDIYTFSTENIITQNPIGLLNEIIDKTEFNKYVLFPIEK